MSFIRENLLKIIGFIILLVIFIVVFSFIFGKRNIVADNSTYPAMEENLLSSAKKYAKDNTKLIPTKEDESNKITLDTLEKFNYIKVLTAIEDENVKCNGYVEILYRNKKNIYVPYLKCGKYYETRTMAKQILSQNNIVTSEDGIYKMGNLYVYRGENINNYILVGNRLYRIMDFDEEGNIRIISVDKIQTNFIWDNRYNIEKERSCGVNNYSKSRLKETFNYLVSHNYDTENDYNSLFSDQEMEKMVPHDICVGKRYKSNGSIDSSVECQVTEPNQYLSLITISDFARASIDPNCKTIYDNSCVNYNYLLDIDTSFRTITAVADNTYEVYDISLGVADTVNASTSFRPNIVIYLDKLSLYNSGDGTEERPFTIR